MANTQATCTSFKVDLYNGIHAFGASVVRGTTAKDAFKMALYESTAVKDATTTVYNTTGEVTSGGSNYTAGGESVTTATAPASSGTTAYFTPSASVVFTNVTLPTAFNCAVLYNDTAVGKNAVAVFVFGAQTVTAGDFTLTMPTNDATTGLLRLG